MARACGSYPQCHRFESSYRYQWPGGQEVKTPPFHGGHASPILARVTILICAGIAQIFFGRIAQLVRAFASHARGHRFESRCVHHAKTRMGAEFFSIPCGFIFLSELRVRQNYDSFTTMLCEKVCRILVEMKHYHGTCEPSRRSVAFRRDIYPVC